MAIMPITNIKAATVEEAIQDLVEALASTASDLDLDGFAANFWQDPKLLYVYNGRCVHGWQAVVDQHRDSWEELKDSDFRLGKPQITILGGQAAAATAEGSFKVTYTNGTVRSGHFLLTLVCVYRDGYWQIVQAHESSTRPSPA